MMEKIKKLFFQGIRFSLVGVINTLIDMGVYYLLTLIPFFATYYGFANVLSYSCGVVNSLFMNKRFTFRERQGMGARRVALFLVVNLVSLGVSTLVLYIGSDVLLWPGMLAKLLAVVASLGVNFTLNKLFVFKG